MIDEYTEWFKKKYGTPKLSAANKPNVTNEEWINLRWNLLLEEYENVDKEEVRLYLDSRNYVGVFLNSHWWYVISPKKKLMDGYKCQGDDCDGNYTIYDLEVHHLTYEHKGEEVMFMDSLITLCNTCHSKIHDKPIKKKLIKPHKKEICVDIEMENDAENYVPTSFEPNEILLNFNNLAENIKVESNLKNFIIKIESLDTYELHAAINNNLKIILNILN